MEHDDAILKIVKVESGKKINWMLNVLKIILDSWYGIRNKHVGRQLSGERERGEHAANGHRSDSKPGQCFLTKRK